MDTKGIIAKSRSAAKRTTAESLRRARNAAERTGMAGSLYRAANKATVVGVRTVSRARRVAERKLDERGLVLEVEGRPSLRRLTPAERDPKSLPDAFPTLPADEAEGLLTLPPRINWSDPHRIFDMSDDDDRAEAYLLLLREGNRADIEAHVDGLRLAALWDSMLLPQKVRERFEPLVAAVSR